MRSYAHMSNERLDQDTEQWVLEVLIPKLDSETGLTWNLGRCFSDKKLTNNILVSNECFMHLTDNITVDFLKICNKPIASLQKLYPSMSDEFVGYKVLFDKKSHEFTNNWPRSPKNYIACWGYWALDLNPILERGKTMAKRFGI